MSVENPTAGHLKQTPPAHMPSLDGLRGLAILLVLAAHASIFYGFGTSGLGLATHQVVGTGWSGVDLFFVLSGFLITGILLSTKESKLYYKSFFARRFLRIIPLYYLFLAVLFLRYRHQYTGSDIASLMLYSYNLHAVAIGHHLPGVNSFWSLAIEEQFYLVWPFVVAFASDKTLKKVCLAGIVVALVLRIILAPYALIIEPAYLLTPCHIDGLLMGSLLATWRRDPITWRKAYRLSTPVMLMSVAGIVAIALWSGHFFIGVTPMSQKGFRHTSDLVNGPGITFVVLFFSGLLVKCVHQGAVQNLFLNWPLRRIGKYSYGMYMLHWALLMGLRATVMPRISAHFNLFATSVLMFVLLTAASFACAFVSFNLFEKRFLSLKRHFPAVESLPAPELATHSRSQSTVDTMASIRTP